MLKGELMEAKQRRRDETSGVPTKNGTRNILVLGDLHIGSMYGLLPPDFVSCDGSISPWSLVGLGFNAIWYLRWADPIAALVIVPLILRQGWEAMRGKPCGCC